MPGITYSSVRGGIEAALERRHGQQEYIQALSGHADEKMTKHYQEAHDEKKIECLEVGVELAF